MALLLPVHVRPNWLDAALADSMLRYAISHEAAFRPGTVLYEGEKRREPMLRFVLKTDDIGPFAEVLKTRALAMVPALCDALGVPVFSPGEFEMEFAAHGEGAHFLRHMDTAVAINRRAEPRTLSLVLYLNREPKRYSGGMLRMYALDGDDERDYEPQHNLLVAFPSIAPHSVQPVRCPGDAFADRRFAVNIWIHRAAAEGDAKGQIAP